MRRSRFLIALAALLLASPLIAFAAGPTTLIPEGGTIGGCNIATGEIHFNCVPLYVAYIVEFLFGAIGTFALIQIIYAGYQMALGPVTGKAEDGKNRLKTAIIGLVIAALSFAIINFVIDSIIS